MQARQDAADFYAGSVQSVHEQIKIRRNDVLRRIFFVFIL
jgi:hypothetical protein